MTEPEMPNKVSLYDASGLENLRRRHRLQPQQLRQLRNRFCKQFHADETAGQFVAEDQLQLHWLTIHSRCDSQQDGASKLLLKTTAGMLIEAVVLRIATGRTTLCVSSQVGCAAACQFCATGKMGVAHNLSADEILDQVLLAGQLLRDENRQLRNIVFMGMGEPFHNLTNLVSAIETLTSSDYFNHAPSRILISSVGIVDEMLAFARQFPHINLAISLHSVRQKVREQLIPLAKRYSLAQLRNCLAELNQIQSRPVMVEYLMLDGVNDSLDDANELAKWLAGLNIHVNLIPFNPIDEAPELIGSSVDAIRAFSDHLKSIGLKTTTRHSLGNDIAAACGQLVQTENRRIAQSLALGNASAVR